MSVVTYTALRKMEAVSPAFAKAGIDISAALADNSFNATATDLSGLLDNEWVLVAGFVNAANNGWFQLSANSTATKILQDTSAALVTEAAGPSVSITGYKRGLGQSYQIEFGAVRLDRNVSVSRSQQLPMGGGAPEVLLHRREEFERVVTGILTEAQILQWREFLASVEGGETFTFDKYGTIAEPVAPVNVMLASESYDEMRDRSSFRYSIAFDLRLLP